TRSPRPHPPHDPGTVPSIARGAGARVRHGKTRKTGRVVSGYVILVTSVDRVEEAFRDRFQSCR
ncbi:MAG: hypothetical protein KBH78_09440, partial [Candidatus Hydrogenedentes bacterium]|nr:hypothetical protein [Candidatus Hydrogenedentota bacterium]